MGSNPITSTKTMYKKEFITTDPLLKDYQIDTNGNIYSKKGHIMRPSKNKKGYIAESFVIDGRRITRSVHRLVANQFIPNPFNKRAVNHIDGDKSNNCVENLEWVTDSENMKHSFHQLNRKRSRAEIVICRHPLSGDEVICLSITEAANYMKISKAAACSSVVDGHALDNGYILELVK